MDLFRLCPPPPSTLCSPQLQSTCHYIVNHYGKILHVHLGVANNKLSWGGGGAQTEKILFFNAKVDEHHWSSLNVALSSLVVILKTFTYTITIIFHQFYPQFCINAITVGFNFTAIKFWVFPIRAPPPPPWIYGFPIWYTYPDGGAGYLTTELSIMAQTLNFCRSFFWSFPFVPLQYVLHPQ